MQSARCSLFCRQTNWYWLFPSKWMLAFKVIWNLSAEISDISEKELHFFCRLYVLLGWPNTVVFLKKLLKKMVELQPSALFFLQDLQVNSVPYSTCKGHFWKSIYEWQFKVLWNLSKLLFGIIFLLGHSDLQSRGLVSFTQINFTVFKT